MSAGMAQTDDAPRGEIDLYGEPIAVSGHDEAVLCEAYVDDDSPGTIFVAKYVENEGEWVKVGLEKMSLSLIFEEAKELRLGEW